MSKIFERLMQKLKINLRIYVGIEMALVQDMLYYHLRKVGKKFLMIKALTEQF